MSIDYFPTALELAGVKAPARSALDGVSILPLLKDSDAALDREALYWHYPHYHPGGATPYGAVRVGDYRLVEFFEDDRVELYNVREDIGEKTDLAAKMPAKRDELRSRLRAWRTSVGAQMPTPNPRYDAQRDRAKARKKSK
jgi:arylsulfatase A-like enzyme